MISAFTIFLAYDKAVLSEKHPVQNFFIRRLLRILPVYWLGIILYTAVYGMDSRGWLPGPQPWHYPLHFSLTNIFVPNAMSSVVPGGWSISVEVMFYLTVPLWFVLIKNLKRAIIFTLGSMIIGPVLCKMMSIFFPLPSDIDSLNAALFWGRQPIYQLGCFGTGMVLFFLLKEEAVQAVISKRGVSRLCFIGFPIFFVCGVFVGRILHIPGAFTAAGAFLVLALSIST